MDIQNQLKIKQHCAKAGCCDFEEMVISQQLWIGEEIPTIDIPIGCLKAPLNAQTANAVGFYFGMGVATQSVFDYRSRKYLREATAEEAKRWQASREKYMREHESKSK
jgi:hypothetical protein